MEQDLTQTNAGSEEATVVGSVPPVVLCHVPWPDISQAIQRVFRLRNSTIWVPTVGAVPTLSTTPLLAAATFAR